MIQLLSLIALYALILPVLHDFKSLPINPDIYLAIVLIVVSRNAFLLL